MSLAILRVIVFASGASGFKLSQIKLWRFRQHNRLVALTISCGQSGKLPTIANVIRTEVLLDPDLLLDSFVMTFCRELHSGFLHGLRCGERAAAPNLSGSAPDAALICLRDAESPCQPVGNAQNSIAAALCHSPLRRIFAPWFGGAKFPTLNSTHRNQQTGKTLDHAGWKSIKFSIRQFSAPARFSAEIAPTPVAQPSHIPAGSPFFLGRKCHGKGD